MVDVVDYDRQEVEEFVKSSGKPPVDAANDYIGNATAGIEDIRKQLTERGVDVSPKEDLKSKLKSLQFNRKLELQLEKRKKEKEKSKTEEITIGGQKYLVPSDPELKQQAISNFRKTEEFENMIDRYKGASAGIRAMVGSAPNPADRLATIRNYYPDAESYGSDNFVFTHPDTGMPTLYNPPGLDWGDVAGVAREITQGAGGAVGAVLGGIGGGVAGSPTGPGALGTASYGAALGAGLGTAAAGNLFDGIANYFGGRVDTRSTLEVVADTSLDVASGFAGQKLGEAAEYGVKRFIAGSDRSAALLDDYVRFKISADAAAITNSRPINMVQHGLSVSPGGAGTIHSHAQKIVGEVKTAVSNVSNKFGSPRTPKGAGQAMQKAAQESYNRFKIYEKELYDKAFDLVDQNTLVQMGATRGLLSEMRGKLAQSPESLKTVYGPAIKFLERIKMDTNTNRVVNAESNIGWARLTQLPYNTGIPFSRYREIRTNLIKEIDDYMISGLTGSQKIAMNRVKGALTRDMWRAVRGTGREASEALKKADKVHKDFMKNNAKLLDKFMKFDAEEKAWLHVWSAKRDNAKSLLRLKNNFTEDEWGIVSSSILSRLGKANPGAQNAAGDQFSLSTFMTNWNKISAESKGIIFGGKTKALRRELDGLVRVIDSLKKTDDLANRSQTAINSISYGFLSALGGGVVFGGVEVAAPIVTASYVAPKVAAKLITSPKFVNWLATPVKPNSIGPHIGRLYAIAEDQPEIRSEIQHYIESLKYRFGVDEEQND